MRKKLAKLVDVKSIVTILLTLSFVYLAIGGVIDGADFKTIFIMVITFYFTRRTETNDKETPLDTDEY